MCRVISINDVAFLRSDEGDKAFAEAWKALVEERELVCTQTSTSFPPLPKPQAIILDVRILDSIYPMWLLLNIRSCWPQFFAIDGYNSVKAISGNSVKAFTWHPGSTYAMFYLFGPESLGGKGNIRLKAEEIVRQTGRPFDDVVREVRSL